MKQLFYAYVSKLQDEITKEIEFIDGGKKFDEDFWKRPGGGGGRTRVIENGNIIEKGGVNISSVFGKLPNSLKNYLNTNSEEFYACGLSIILHPINPFVPSVHANWRYFELCDRNNIIEDQWFGGGLDLTPYYVNRDDIIHFHRTLKNACDIHDLSFYEKFKTKCDKYFWNTHRHEARGVGGIFFDYCRPSKEFSLNQWFNFIKESGNCFLNAYGPIIINNKDKAYSEDNKLWQEIRRGRYVEFNLIHDKGTLFGIKTNGRIESILISLPKRVQWHYNYNPKKESEEEKLINVLKNPQDWL